MHSELMIEDCLETLLRWETRDERCELLRQALDTLTLKQKERVLKYCEEKNSREIAEEEGINYSAVDKSIRMGIKKLKKWFQAEGIADVATFYKNN